MKQKFMKWITAALIGTMAFSLAACGGTGTKDSETVSGNETAAGSEEETGGNEAGNGESSEEIGRAHV